MTARPPSGADWPATDLGFLLHKNPARAHTFDVPFGRAHVVYPRADAVECTAALLVEVDPVGLARGRSRAVAEFSLGAYVNDRPYAASSLLASTLARVFSTALRGRCEQRPELAARPVPLRVELPALPCDGGPELARRLLAPLGWQVSATPAPLDSAFPEWGDSRYLRLVLRGEVRVADALSHLYVLLPTLDGAKHYWISIDEVDKLIRAGGGWLATHPERELIAQRYLARRQSLTRLALARLAEADELTPEQVDDAVPAEAETQAEDGVPVAPLPPLAVARREAVLACLREVGARRVLDLGCGGGALLRDLLAESWPQEVVGVDVSVRALAAAARRLRVDRLPERAASRLTLRQGSLTYADPSLRGYDAAVLMEVVEHVDPGRLGALEHAVFGVARPGAVVVTTPNVEHNVLFPGLPAGARRHRDHRFEWTRAQFRAWAGRVAAERGYLVSHRPVGPVDAELGPPTQLALFRAAGDAGRVV